MGRLIVVTTDELAPGFRLAGVATEVVDAPAAAVRLINRLLTAGEGGVIAVHEPLLEGIDAATRRRFEDAINPIVVALPSGAREPGEPRRARLSKMLHRAIGYRITFESEEAL